MKKWADYIPKQKETCKKHGSEYIPVSLHLFIAASDNLESDAINGLRHPSHGSMDGWYIWGGEWSNNDDFFRPICAEHLIKLRPEIIKYLGLSVGYRFLADKKGYEDVWFDEKITELND